MSRVLPLTRAQTGIWFAQQRDPQSPAFNCAEYVRIRGPLGPTGLERLQWAVRRVVAETWTLTARVDESSAGDGEPHQVLGARWRDPVRIVDVSTAADPDAAAQQVMREETAVPLNPGHDDLFSAVVLSLGEDADVLLYLRAHHLVLDGFGFSSVIRRIATHFTASERGVEPPASPFAPLDGLLAEEEAYRASPDFVADRGFWTRRMDGSGDAVSLAEEARPAARTVLRRDGRLPGATARALDEAARSRGCAWPELVLAASAAYVATLTGSPDVVLGLPVLARTGPAATKTATTTVNVLPLPLTVDAGRDVGSLARAVRDEVAAGRAHQRYRHEDLRRDLGLVGGTRRLNGPQINIKPFGYPLRFGDRRATVHYLAAGPVEDIELTVHTAAPDGGLGFDMTANPLLYDAEELAAHHDRLHELITRIATGGEQVGAASGAGVGLDVPVRRLDMTTAAERHLIDDCNDTAHDVDRATLIDRIESAARRAPDAPALRFRGRTMTYGELDRRADRLAAILRADHGIGSGTAGSAPSGSGSPVEIVAVALPRSFDLLVGLLAALKCGAAYLPVDPDYPDERIHYLLDHAGPGCVITSGEVADRIGADPHTPRVRLDDAGVRAVLDGQAPDPRPDVPVTRAADLIDRPAYVIYTSGSTGAPKGVVVPHRAIVNRLAWMQHAFDLRPDDAVLQKTPSGFDVSVWEFFWPLITGSTLVIAEPGGHRDPAYLAGLIADEAVTTVHFVPSMLEAFLGEPDVRRRPATSLRRIVCSGEALDAEVADRAYRLLGAPVYNLYGPTEAAVDVSWWRHRPGSPSVPIGHPVWNTRLHVLGPGLRPVPPGAAGDLYIAGIQLADGYLHRPDLTAQRFVADPSGAPGARMYRTGDQARRRRDGAIEYLGRDDDQVKIRGVRIEPSEIAAAMRGIDGVRQAAVVASGSGAGGSGAMALVGYAVLDDGAELEASGIRHALTAALPAAMVPAHVVLIDSLPVTANGKLDRAALPAPDPTGTDPTAAPRSPHEQVLCEIMAEVLGLRAVAPTDDFFDLGGHSLAAVALVRRLREELGAEVGVGTVFAAPDARTLAAELDAGTADRSLDVLFPLRAGGAGPTLYCVHPAGGLGWCYAGLARRLPAGSAVTAVQARGLDGRSRLPQSIDEMAADYVDAIRADGDAGPYHLLGWSVGGVIAHAMAELIERTGGTVASLTMLDSYPSDQWRDLEEPTEEKALRALLHMAGQDPDSGDEGGGAGGGAERGDGDGRGDGSGIGVGAEHGDGAVRGDGDGARAAVLDRLRRGGSALGSLGDETLSAVIDIVANNARLMREHRHRPYSGDLLFFTAAAPREESWLDREAWAPHIAGVIDGHDLQCTHPEMIGEHALDRIAPAVAELLDPVTEPA